MQLEDHAGDILRKACAMNRVPAAAFAAELSADELAAFQETGRCDRQLDFAALARIAGLDPRKFAGLAGGWLPAPVGLDRWRQLRVFTSAGKGLMVNCQLGWDEPTREAALFDTGLDAAPILACLAENQLQLRHIFITHAHWDHVEALPAIRAAWPQAAIHAAAAIAPADQRLRPGRIIALGSLRVAHRETPGHAEDGVTYLVGGWPDGAPAVAMVGDAIFAGSMGRGNQSWELARQKIRAEILSLPPETLICPGHGPLTTVAEERAHNPFF